MIMHGKRLFATAFIVLSGFASGLWAAETRVVTILGSSDVHGYFVPWDYATDTAFPAGGLSKIATVANRLRAENPDLVLVDAGDLIQGNFTETFKAEKTNPMMLGLNAARYDIFVPGNHEFNFGMGALNSALSTFKGKALAGNICTTKDAGRFLPVTAIIERNGIRIGFSA